MINMVVNKSYKEVDIKDKLTLTDNNTKFELAIGDINKLNINWSINLPIHW